MSFNYTYWGGIKLKELQKILSFWWWWFAPKKCQKMYIYININTVIFANRFSIGRQCLFLVHQISWAFRRTGHVSWFFHTYKKNSHVFFLEGAKSFPNQKMTNFQKNTGDLLFFPPKEIRLQGAGALVLSLQQENGMKKSWFKLYWGKNRGYGVSSPIIFRG